MDHRNQSLPNVMPNAMVEPITDMELIVAKLKYQGELNKNSTGTNPADHMNKEV